ncbi:cytidylate kinase [Abditibacterium utsteinense]|uniref:Cytidylate kinase n=1 Tax=Abditibacterium utsteinense TaxID=1960156 RepID=A0A2S8SP14_9BACT|nr:(d)CMP kinase [Abditibacterium utsteinense]PQV62531.1 cytidylate kinase [Abditibacterium utsteinense]
MEGVSTMIIAIDGPAGAGKGTTAKLVAHELGFAYVDTGAMYRAIALRAHELGFRAPNDATRIAQLSESAPIHFGAGGTQISCDGRDYSNQIRTPEVGALASKVAVLPEVRHHIVERQREIGLEAQSEFGGAVLEGRDIQTVVFPDADLKIFLTASPDARANRRLLQWQKSSQSGDLEDALRDILERDERDSSRETSPLKAADDAVHVLTDEMTPQQVAAQIVELARQKLGTKTS